MVFKRKGTTFGERRLIPRRKYPRPMRYVGIGIIIMAVLVYILWKLMVR